MFIYRDEYYNPENEEAKGIAEVAIAKHRNGPAGTHVELSFLSRYPKFANLARTDPLGGDPRRHRGAGRVSRRFESREPAACSRCGGDGFVLDDSGDAIPASAGR